MTIPSLITKQGTLFDYDLNIYHLEEEVGQEAVLEGIGDPIYAYTDQWYVDIYSYEHNSYGGSEQTHVTGPFKLSGPQAKLLQLDNEKYWDDDSWYGMWGFIQDYGHVILPELQAIFDALPKYREEVLF